MFAGVKGFFKSAIATAVDQYFNLVTLLLNTTSTNGAQNNTFLDSSSNNFTITRNGNTTQGTFTPFSQTGWSAYMNGGSTTGLQFPFTSSWWTIASSGNAWTLEAWVYVSAVNSQSFPIFATGSGIGTSGFGTALYINTSFGVEWYWQFSPNLKAVTPNNSITKNAWNHVAVTCSGTALTIYINGVSQTLTGTTNQTAASTGTYGQIGNVGSPAAYGTGYISNLRLSKSVRYSANFTPSTTPFVSDANTSLLLLTQNRFSDIGPNNASITVSGSPSVQAFSPFAPTAAYGAATVGGSGYFDGSGDYLSFPSNTLLNPESGDFTIEAWVYPTNTSSTAEQTIIAYGVSAGNLRFQINNIRDLRLLDGATLIAQGSSSINLFSWNHVVAIRSGSGANNLKLYVNGAQVAQSSSANTTNYTGTATVGDSSSRPLFGYMTGLRFIKGQALASGAFTPPTSPVTTSTIGWTGANVASSITGSVNLLLSFTNAGIYDSSAKNDLETVGNAQVSTTQAKFGGTSMYFDGTGDYLVSPTSQLNNIFPSDLTIECFVYFNSVANTPHIWNIGTATANRVTLYLSGAKVNLYSDTGSGGTNKIVGTTTITTGQWYYVALTKSGTTFTLYVDGVSQGTSTTTVYPNAANQVALGFNNFGSTSGDYLNGYIDEFRITRGFARTVTSVPTSVFPVQ